MHELPHANFTKHGSYEPKPFVYTKLQNAKECTGTLVADVNGYVYHGRNMDKGTDQTRNITLKMTFIKSGIVIANVTDYYWFNVGFVTGFKSGVASISENWRNVY